MRPCLGSCTIEAERHLLQFFCKTGWLQKARKRERDRLKEALTETDTRCFNRFREL